MNPHEMLVLILSTKVGSESKKRLEERVVANLCLQPLVDGSDCTNAAVKDGICLSCYNRRRNRILSQRMSQEREAKEMASLERKGHRCSYRKRKEILERVEAKSRKRKSG